jgi:predicted AlkP superfamily pyrophosphatase or phosphodiesterase
MRILLVVLGLLMNSTCCAENLILMGWDGAGLKSVAPMLENNELPNLSDAISKGALLCPLESHERTTTVVGWTQVLTGLGYDQSGVLGCAAMDKRIYGTEQETRKRVKFFYKKQLIFTNLSFWVDHIPYNYTIFDPIGRLGKKIGYITSKGYLGSDASVSPLSSIQQYANVFATYPFVEYQENYLELAVNDALDFISNNDNFFLFIHVNPDAFGHKYGFYGERYREEIRKSDQAFGRILQRCSGKDCKYIVTNDHGFDVGEYNHYNAPDCWMITNLPVDPVYRLQDRQRAFGTMRDIAPTILEWYSVDWQSRQPRMRGKSLLE